MRVAIAGAGNVGRSIARELLENGHEVLLIDKAPTAISVERVPQAEWLLADACEITSLDEAALQRCNVVIAATGDDKVNLVVSLLAKTEYGVPRVVEVRGMADRQLRYKENPLDPRNRRISIFLPFMTDVDRADSAGVVGTNGATG